MARPDLLVFGGTGLLGSALVQAADNLGLAAAATVHQNEPADHHVGTAWHRVELANSGEAADLILSLGPSVVINAAYVQGGPDLEAVTSLSPGEMAAACAKNHCRFVQVSSDVVFNGATSRPYRETDPVSPVHGYGRAKAAAEMLVTKADPTAVVVRTSLLWGSSPVGPQARLVADPTMEFFTDEIRCPIRVDRLADALIEIAFETTARGLLHVAGADAVDRLTFARLLAPLLGVPAESLRGRTSGNRPDRPRDCRLDSSRGRALLSTPLTGALTDLGG